MLAPRTMHELLEIASLPPTDIKSSSREIARLSLFDWLVVARAGMREPLAEILRSLVAEESGQAAASVVGLPVKVPARAAALVNGAISHALDYDDTHFAHIGHPSVAVLPAALATAEAIDAPASAVLDALLLGAEASIRVGVALGRPHYDRGFHQTATSGAFGATVAAARVLGLNRETTRHALSLVSTRASGLKSQFGSMGKPYNAGLAAANGVEAAELARRGFLSCDDGVGGPQGFIDAHVDQTFESEAWAEAPPKTFLFEDIKHKLHACCHGLHATLEALRKAQRQCMLGADDAQSISIRVNPRWLRVCDIKKPRTGLEAKFSFTTVVAMTLVGIDTASDAAYTDALCCDPGVTAIWPRVEVTGDRSLADSEARLRIERSSGPAIETAHDLAVRLPSATLARGLRRKAVALLGEAAAQRLWCAAADLETLAARDLGHLLQE